jgi:DNA adenine methylase
MKSCIKWNGGKSRELKRIIPLVPKYDTYIEPFLGGGALFFELMPQTAIINDINPTLMNFWYLVKNDVNYLKTYIKNTQDTAEYYYQLRNEFNNKNLSKKDMACAFYYFNRTGFNGLWRVNSKGEYNVAYDNINKRDLNILMNECIENSKVLEKATLYSDDFRNIIEKYKNDDNAFIFLDPPYLNCKNMYTKSQEFLWIYEYIMNYLEECKCKVMLITKADDILIDMFKNFNNDLYGMNYSANNKYNKKVKHMLITNY